MAPVTVVGQTVILSDGTERCLANNKLDESADRGHACWSLYAPGSNMCYRAEGFTYFCWTNHAFWKCLPPPPHLSHPHVHWPVGAGSCGEEVSGRGREISTLHQFCFSEAQTPGAQRLLCLCNLTAGRRLTNCMRTVELREGKQAFSPEWYSDECGMKNF